MSLNITALHAADFISNVLFKKKIINTRESNILDPDQSRHSCGPDLGPLCLQRLSEDDTKLSM